ncbi:hypothetical protein GCM10028867_40260 [Nocardioides pacificus]
MHRGPVHGELELLCLEAVRPGAACPGSLEHRGGGVGGGCLGHGPIGSGTADSDPAQKRRDAQTVENFFRGVGLDVGCCATCSTNEGAGGLKVGCCATCSTSEWDCATCSTNERGCATCSTNGGAG